MPGKRNPHKDMIGVYVREDHAANLIHVEHIYLFRSPDGLHDIVFSRDYGHSAATCFDDLFNYLFDLWAPVVTRAWMARATGKENQGYLQFDRRMEPRYIYGGTWRCTAER
jgi:hypothetical protein